MRVVLVIFFLIVAYTWNASGCSHNEDCRSRDLCHSTYCEFGECKDTSIACGEAAPACDPLIGCVLTKPKDVVGHSNGTHANSPELIEYGLVVVGLFLFGTFYIVVQCVKDCTQKRDSPIDI